MTIKRCAFGLIIAALICVSLPAAAKDTAVDSVWAAAPVNVDGSVADWNDVTPATDKGSGGRYALKNDGKAGAIPTIVTYVDRNQYEVVKNGGGISTDGTNIFRIKNSYANFNLGDVNFMVGLQYRVLNRGSCSMTISPARP